MGLSLHETSSDANYQPSLFFIRKCHGMPAEHTAKKLAAACLESCGVSKMISWDNLCLCSKDLLRVQLVHQTAGRKDGTNLASGFSVDQAST